LPLNKVATIKAHEKSGIECCNDDITKINNTILEVDYREDVLLKPDSYKMMFIYSHKTMLDTVLEGLSQTLIEIRRYSCASITFVAKAGHTYRPNWRVNEKTLLLVDTTTNKTVATAPMIKSRRPTVTIGNFDRGCVGGIIDL
jgi:hypothetical protein